MKKFEIDPNIHPARNQIRAYFNAKPYIESAVGCREIWRLKKGVSPDKQYLLDELLYWTQKAHEAYLKEEERITYYA